MNIRLKNIEGESVPSVAVIGTRGYPSYYGGFETAVRKIAPHLSDMGWDVIVYGRPGTTRPDDPCCDRRVSTPVTRGLETRNLSTLTYGLTSSAHASIRKPDVALVMNVANGYFLPLLRARGIPSLVNVDGIEWERAKWSPLAKKVFRAGAVRTSRWADQLVFDSLEIEKYWRATFNADGIFIPYGGDVPRSLPVPEQLQHRGYVLVVARFVPENSIPAFFSAVPSIASRYPVVIVGSTGYGGELDERARQLAHEFKSVSWLGHVSDDSLLLALWQHAGLYFHGHTVGGTNPALVQAMAAGAPVLARDTPFNREVLGPTGNFVGDSPADISASVTRLMMSEGALEVSAQSNQANAQEHYSWASVCDRYDRALRGLLSANTQTLRHLSP